MQLRTRRRSGAVALALALVGATIVPLQAHAAEGVDGTPQAFERGHVDAFNMTLNPDDSVNLLLKEDVTGSHVARTPETVDLIVKGAAETTFATPFAVPQELHGKTVYRLPLNQNQNLLWPGWDTNALVAGYGSGVSVDFEIDVDGPGGVWLWTQTEDGPESLLAGGEYRLDPAGVIRQGFPSHTHAAWAFESPGEYTLSVTAQVRGSDGDGSEKTATSNTAVYSFMVDPTAEITGLADAYTEGDAIELQAGTIPAIEGGSYEWTLARSGEDPEVISDQSGTGLELTAAADLDDAEVSVRFIGDGGTEVTAAEPVVINVEESAVDSTLVIEGLRHHYHQGGTIALTATADPEVADASVEWFLQRIDQDEPVRVAGTTGAEFQIAAEQALDDARVSANLLDADGDVVASADAVTIDIDDHGAAAFNQVVVEGLRHHYHTGDTAALTAEVSPASVLDRYEWQVRESADAEWGPLSDERSAAVSFEIAAADHGREVRAVLTFNDGRAYVASEPVTISVDDHDHDHGDDDHDHGDDDHDHGDDDHGDEDGSGDDQTPAKPESAPSQPDEAVLDEVAAGGIELDRESAAPGDALTIQVGDGAEHAGTWVAAWMFSEPTLLGDDWQLVGQEGTITVAVPLDAEPSAEHRVAVFDADGALVGWQSLTVAEADVPVDGENEDPSAVDGSEDPEAAQAAKTAAREQSLATTGTEIGLWVVLATLLLAAGAGTVFVARRRNSGAVEH